MNRPRPILDHLERVLADPTRGVIGLVDELLNASRQQDIRVEWQAGSCQLFSSNGVLHARSEVPLRKSVARAALARIAALCNEQCPDSVSPYGGQGAIAIEGDSSKLIRASFVNTPETLTLDLAAVSSEVVSPIDLSFAKSPD